MGSIVIRLDDRWVFCISTGSNHTGEQMIDCPFACETPRGIKCNYTDEPCWGDSHCETLQMAVEAFEGMLDNGEEVNWSTEFMASVVEYGNKEK